MSALTPDLAQAERFLTLLDESAESFTFQTFTDSKDKPYPDPLAAVRHGTLAKHAAWLTAMNRKGAGIFVCVNATDGKGRANANIVKIRALWVDDDTGQAPALPIEPHVIVQTSPGKRQAWVFVDGMQLADFDATQARMIADFGSDQCAAGINRVLRLPGFWHLKDKAHPHRVAIIGESGTRPYPWSSLRTILPPAERKTQPPKDTEARVYVTPGQVAELRSALNMIPADDYGTWVSMGHALVELGNVGRGLWLDWSQTSPKWRPQDAAKWGTFTGDQTSSRAVFAEAQRRGWVNPRARDAEVPPPPPQTPRPDTQGERRAWLTPVGELLQPPPPLEWLVKGILLPLSLIMIAGDPQGGKSLLATWLAACIAMGKEWLGRRVKRGPVVIIAGEGHFGIRRRLKAWAIAHDCEAELSQAPLFVSSSGTSLIDRKARDEVIAEIDAVAEEHGPPALVVIDTLHRNMGGDENSAEDMAIYFAHADEIRFRYQTSVMTIHHTGHGDKERGRGTSSIRAALDIEYLLSSNGETRTLKATKTKDMPAPPPMAFTLRQIPLPWRDSDGDPETSVVLEATDAPAAQPGSKASATIRLGVESFLAVLDASEGGDIALEEWREEFYARHTGDNPTSKRQAFLRVRSELVSERFLECRNDLYSIAPSATAVKWKDVAGLMLARAITKKP